MTFDELFKWVQAAGLVGFLLVTVYAAWRGWWVPGRFYEQMKAERDEWRGTAQAAIANGEKLLQLLERGARRSSG